MRARRASLLPFLLSWLPACGGAGGPSGSYVYQDADGTVEMRFEDETARMTTTERGMVLETSEFAWSLDGDRLRLSHPAGFSLDFTYADDALTGDVLGERVVFRRR